MTRMFLLPPGDWLSCTRSPIAVAMSTVSQTKTRPWTQSNCPHRTSTDIISAIESNRLNRAGTDWTIFQVFFLLSSVLQWLWHFTISLEGWSPACMCINFMIIFGMCLMKMLVVCQKWLFCDIFAYFYFPCYYGCWSGLRSSLFIVVLLIGIHFVRERICAMQRARLSWRWPQYTARTPWSLTSTRSSKRNTIFQPSFLQNPPHE